MNADGYGRDVPTVKYLPRSDEWVVLESRRRGGDMGELVLMEKELSAVSATMSGMPS